MFKNYRNYKNFRYLNSSVMLFSLAVSVRSTWAEAEVASVKSLLNLGASGFVKVFLYKKLCDKQMDSVMHKFMQ